MSLRSEFVLLASQPDANIRALCRRYGIAPATAYKWLARYRNEGDNGLADRSRRPHHSPSATPDDIVSLVLHTASATPYNWRARKVKAIIENQGLPAPAVSTIQSILSKHLPVASVPPKGVGRFEHDAPNQLWQMDFKGHFAWQGGRSHPLTLIDDHSRFALCIRHCRDERKETVQQHLVQVFERYGVPERMTMDNGAPWGDRPGVWTSTELWLMRQNIRISHSRPGHPQTQGKLERLHKSLKSELLQLRWFLSEEELQRAFDHWRDAYNLERPHEGLGMEVPASRYRASARAYDPAVQAPEYSDEMMKRKVDSEGYFYLKGEKFKAGKAFRREYIGLRACENEGVEVWWYSHIVGKIDLKSRSIFMGKQC